MQDIRLLESELKIKPKWDSTYTPDYISLQPIGTESSTRLVGFQLINGSQQYLLCLNKAIYICEEEEIICYRPLKCGRICHSYLYIDRYPTSVGKYCSAHAFFMSDGSISICRYNGADIVQFEEVVLPTAITLRKAFLPCLPASSSLGIFFSFDRKEIQCWGFQNGHSSSSNSLRVRRIYKLSMGELMYYGFMNAGDILLCLYRNTSTGALYAEHAVRRSGNYCFAKRYVISPSISSNTIFKQLNDSWIICAMAHNTWSFKTDCSPYTFRNLGIDPKITMLNIDWRNKKEKESVIFDIYDSSGQVYEAIYTNSSHKKPILRWAKKDLHIPGSSKVDEIDFIARIHSNLYLIVSKVRGITILNRASKTVTKVSSCPYKNVIYLDGNSISNGGSNLDSVILCGAYTNCHGFLEKQYLQYDKNSSHIVFTQNLSHTPVENIWASDLGLVYESMGNLYKANSDEKFRDFKNGVWFTKNGIDINDEHNNILFTSPLSSHVKDVPDSLLILFTNGDLKALKFRSQNESEQLFSLELGPQVIDSTVAAGTYNFTDESFYVATYHEYGWLSLYSNVGQVFKVPLDLDYFVAELLVKIIDATVYVIATSFDGRGRVYVPTSNSHLLEIIAPSGTQLRVTDVGIHISSIILYNEQDVILVQLEEMIHGALDLGISPIQIVPCGEDRPFAFLVLGNNWSVSLIDFSLVEDASLVPRVKSSLYDLGNFIPLKMLILRTNLAVIVLKNDVRKNLRIILFDFSLMKVIAKYDIDKDCSNILLCHLCSEDFQLNSLSDLLLQNMIIVYYINENVPYFHLFSVNRHALTLQQTEKLLHPALTIAVEQNAMKLVFDGIYTMVYNINVDYKDEKITLQCASGMEFLSSTHLCTEMSSSSKLRTSGPLIAPHRLEVTDNEITSGRADETHNTNSYDLITQVATKRVYMKPKNMSNEAKSLPESRFSKDSDIFREFMRTSKKFEGKYYRIMVDCSNHVYISYSSDEHYTVNARKAKPFCSFRMNETIINVSPISSTSISLKRASTGVVGRLNGEVPLFIITCSNSAVYVLTELTEGAGTNLVPTMPGTRRVFERQDSIGPRKRLIQE